MRSVATNLKGYPVLVDLKRGSDELYMKQRFQSVPHRFFDIEPYMRWEMIEYVVEDMPLLSLNYEMTDVITRDEWDKIGLWVLRFVGGGDNEVNEEVLKWFEKPVKQWNDDAEWTVFGDKEVVHEDENGKVMKESVMRNCYDFRMELGDDDTMYYEVWKPFTCLPYCTYVEKWSDVGHYPFFSNLYVNTTWGLAWDNNFMIRLWGHLGMKGECKLEEMVLDRIKSCQDGGEEEPRVYRMEIDETIETRKRRVYGKRKRYS